jgi:membrane protein
MGSSIVKKVGRLTKSFKAKNAVSLAASVSFFAFLSLFPFLVLLASIASCLFKKKQALVQVDRLLRPFPPDVAATVMTTLTGALNSGRIASVLSLFVLALSSITVFGQLENALHAIMGTKSKIRGWKAKLMTFAFFLAAATILLVLMAGGSAFYLLASLLAKLPLVRARWVIEAGVFAVTTGLFAASFRYLAFVKPSWKSALRGAAVTAVSWEVLKILFGLYVSSISSVTAIYGLLGSVFFLMLWIFYSVLLYFVGALVSVEWDR